MPQQDWFSANAPKSAPSSASSSGGDWFAANAPGMPADARPLTEAEIQAALSEPSRAGFTLSGLGRGLLDTAEGAGDFLITGLRSMAGDPDATLKLARGFADQIGRDVEGVKREPSVVAKVGRAAALPLDAAGLPVTPIAEDIIRGNYGHAAGLALGAGAMLKGPQAAMRIKGARVVTPEVAPEAAPFELRGEPAAATSAPARIVSVGDTPVVRPDLPPEFAAVGEEPAAAAAARPASAMRIAPADAVVEQVQGKLLSGEPLGTPEAREAFAERQRAEAARHGETPALSPDEQLYRELRDDAKANGYTGTDAQLRMEFNRRVTQARQLMAEGAGPEVENGPKALLQAIAEGGGLKLADPVFGGELRALAENSKSLAVGQGLNKSGGVKASRMMPRMELGGVPSVLRNDGGGLSLDGMVEYLRQDPRFAPHIENINDLLEAIDYSSRTSTEAPGASLADALAASGIRKGSSWWAEPDAVTARGVGRLEPATTGEPPADWFTQNAPGAEGGGPQVPGEPVLQGNAGEPPSGGIPPQRPLPADRVLDESFIGKLPEDLQPTLRQVWKDYAGFEDQRRGVQPLERTRALAATVELPESVQVGTAFNAEQVTRAYDNLIGKEREYQQLAPKVADGTATDAEWIRHRELETERVLASELVRGATAEAGRSLRAIRAKVEELKALQAVNQANDPVLARQARQAMAQSPNMFRTYVYGNLVSGIATQERNFMGNALMFLNDLAGDVVMGRPSAAAASIVGAVNGLPRGLKEFAYVMRHGGNAEAGTGKASITAELPGGGLNPWNDVLRMLSATDRLWRMIDNRAEVTRRAWLEAGKGPERIDRAARLMAEHPEWYTEAEAVTTNRLFQDRGGKITQAVIQLREAVPLAYMVVPFVRISANLTRMGLSMSPAPYALKLLNDVAGGDFALGKELTAPGRAGELARARAAYGSAVLAALTPYALSGNVTGDGPRDPGQRALWLQTHQPNSIKIGGRWVSLQTWPGVGLTLQALANGVETARELHATGKPVDPTALAANVLARTVNSITSQSFLQGVEDFQNALQDPGQYALRGAARVIGMTQPLAGLQRSIAQTMDRTVRAPEGIAETLKAGTPGLSQSIPPLLDPFGEPVVRQQSPLTVGFAKMQTPSTDPLIALLLGLGVGQQRPNGRIDLDADGVPEILPRDMETQLAQARGRAVTQAEREVIANTPEFQRLPIEVQRKLLRDVKAGATRRVNEAAKGELLKMELINRMRGRP